MAKGFIVHNKSIKDRLINQGFRYLGEKEDWKYKGQKIYIFEDSLDIWLAVLCMSKRK